LEFPIKVQKPIPDDEFESDFLIQPDIETPDIKPLVLPYYKFAHKWRYTTALWDENSKIPYKNEKSPKESVLPVQGDHYYWLTIGNFLESTIIELPYTINSAKYAMCGSKKYLLPLTPIFFKYFKAEKVSDYLRMNELSGGGVEAILEIPVKKGKILFKKKYHQADNNIQKKDVHLAILPFLKTNHLSIDYTIGVLDARTYRNEQVDISGYNAGTNVDIKQPVVRNQGVDGTVKSYYYKSSHSFDALQIKCKEVNGFIVPVMKQCSGTHQVYFAIDFGTTNTHIEYRLNNNSEKALDNSPENSLWQPLIDINSKQDPINLERKSTFEKEIIPYEFTHTSLHKFPFRTALAF